ncbi:hypothetical protein TRFO_35059 [Tritrichomonas foetus]|uniref:Non-specific serine/threonine protein kinase n=1 Tax=Tritrichomonas foetus TaxID=1144522 RepID=A0A1J4JLS9_9EUKA|nr:hypothetical protein TRFO_35059 [Tritrichomonas foetus]|eukprot:OHS98493.1 hypothetical protein TRFO_35059 [Tritrichomonas foetus]
MAGTARYLSINGHLGIEASRRDDLESLAYTLIYLLKGNLPWMNLPIKPKKGEDKYSVIAKRKISTQIKDLCDGIPEEFAIFLQQVRSLRFEDEPDYAFYKKLFRTLYMKNNYLYDMKYDWSIDLD